MANEHPKPPPTFRIGSELEVRRLGFGAMRITGEGIWGEPDDVPGAKRLLQRVIDCGVQLIDTADSYGPEVSERLIGETLAPYPEDVIIATKGGLLRDGPGQWRRCGRPEHLRRALEGSLRRLRLDVIQLYQLHAVDDEVPLADQVGTLAEMQREGKIRHVGMSNVSASQLEEASAIVAVATVQNRYNLTDRVHEPVLRLCEKRGIGFIPWYPLATGSLAAPGGDLEALAQAKGATAGQLALAWLLHKSPVMLPIPGTSSVAHLEENVGATAIELSPEDLIRLEGAGDSPP